MNRGVLAPVGLSVYNRLPHIKKTVAALTQNRLASDTELYIFSDAPRVGDEALVDEVRNYLHSIAGFKRVEIVERAENNRVANNRNGMRQLLDSFGKIIWLEEDVVTAKGFLEFMNSALDFYESDSRIFSISGYAPPLKLNLREDVFALGRFCAWGFAMTGSSFESIKTIPVDAPDTIDKSRMSLYGDDIYRMLCMDASGQIDALDVKAMYHQYQTSKLTIYPRESLVQNIGCDGSGLHCGKTSKFTHSILWDKCGDFKFIEAIKPKATVVHANQVFRKAKEYSGLKGWYKKSRIRKLWKLIK